MKNKALNEILTLILMELERNPQQFMENMKDSLPKLETTDDGHAFIDVPAYENGEYGTKKLKIKFDPNNILKPGDEGYNNDSWNQPHIPEGWTLEDTGEGPSIEGYMIATLGLPKPPTPRRKPQGF